MARVNPFRPNYPVPPGMFVGRLNEIHKLDRHLLQTRACNPSNFILQGERGIGKTSLLNYVKAVATGGISVEGEQLRFLVVDADIDQATTPLGLIKKLELGLRRQLAETEKARNFFRETWSFIERIEAAGIRLGSKGFDSSSETILDEFSYSLAEVVTRITSADDATIFTTQHDGVLFLIDEADNASDCLQLGSMLKLLCERLQRRGCDQVIFGLAGLPNLRQVLARSHPSSLRIFDELNLETLTRSEVGSVIDIALRNANGSDSDLIEISKEARSSLIYLSEGYPHFIQQFGFSAFEKMTTNTITDDNVWDGAFGPGSALELIGDRYYRDDFYNKIQKDSYRQVLRIMAKKLDKWIQKPEIRKEFRGKDSTLDNAIKALRDRHIILSKEGLRGVYRLQHRGFAYWIKIYTSDPKELQQSAEQAVRELGNEDVDQ